MVDVVLVKLDLQLGVVVLGPLVQPPALHDLGRLLQLEVLARDVAAEELELAAGLGALEDPGQGPREGRDALRVGEGLVELLGRGAELLVVGHRGGVDDAAGVGLGRDGLGLDAGRWCRVVLGGGEAAGGVGAGRVLDVLAVLGDQGGEELEEFAAQLGDELGADEVLDGLLLFGVGVDVNVELQSGVESVGSGIAHRSCRNLPQTLPPSTRETTRGR